MTDAEESRATKQQQDEGRHEPRFLDYMSFINAVALIGGFQVRPTALVQFRPVDLDPAPDATGSDEQTTFESAISAMCANEIGNLRYHRTHQRMISPG
jgi:hypothetical protein